MPDDSIEMFSAKITVLAGLTLISHPANETVIVYHTVLTQALYWKQDHTAGSGAELQRLSEREIESLVLKTMFSDCKNSKIQFSSRSSFVKSGLKAQKIFKTMNGNNSMSFHLPQMVWIIKKPFWLSENLNLPTVNIAKFWWRSLVW